MPVDQLEIFNCEQGTDEWHQCRAGVVTASEMHCVMASGRDGGESATRRKYLLIKAAEIITGKAAERKFQGNGHTERGKEQEPEARRLYEITKGVEVTQVGFMKRGKIGASPDFLVGEDGGGEIKCVLPEILLEMIMKGDMPKEHEKQVQGNLLVSKRKWWDFVAYSPGLPLFIKRQLPDVDLMIRMDREAKAFMIEAEAVARTVMQKSA